MLISIREAAECGSLYIQAEVIRFSWLTTRRKLTTDFLTNQPLYEALKALGVPPLRFCKLFMKNLAWLLATLKIRRFVLPF